MVDTKKEEEESFPTLTVELHPNSIEVTRFDGWELFNARTMERISKAISRERNRRIRTELRKERGVENG